MTTTSPKRILVIAAHPDDIEFSTAGSVANWSDEGAQVTFCVVTNGAAGSNKPGEDLAALVHTREAEQRASAAILGVHDVRFLGYQDGTLQHTLELRRDLTRLIRELKPDRVVCFDPTMVFAGNFYVNHPDHRAAAEAAVYAVFPSAGSRPIFPELLDEGYEPHDVAELYIEFSEKPDLFVDISHQIDRKIQALLFHKSQVGPEVADQIRRSDSETGKQPGYAYAESFKVMKLKDESAKPEATPEVELAREQDR